MYPISIPNIPRTIQHANNHRRVLIQPHRIDTNQLAEKSGRWNQGISHAINQERIIVGRGDHPPEEVQRGSGEEWDSEESVGVVGEILEVVDKDESGDNADIFEHFDVLFWEAFFVLLDLVGVAVEEESLKHKDEEEGETELFAVGVEEDFVDFEDLEKGFVVLG